MSDFYNKYKTLFENDMTYEKEIKQNKMSTFQNDNYLKLQQFLAKQDLSNTPVSHKEYTYSTNVAPHRVQQNRTFNQQQLYQNSPSNYESLENLIKKNQMKYNSHQNQGNDGNFHYNHQSPQQYSPYQQQKQHQSQQQQQYQQQQQQSQKMNQYQQPQQSQSARMEQDKSNPQMIKYQKKEQPVLNIFNIHGSNSLESIEQQLYQQKQPINILEDGIDQDNWQKQKKLIINEKDQIVVKYHNNLIVNNNRKLKQLEYYQKQDVYQIQNEKQYNKGYSQKDLKFKQALENRALKQKDKSRKQKIQQLLNKEKYFEEN